MPPFSLDEIRRLGQRLGQQNAMSSGLGMAVRLSEAPVYHDREQEARNDMARRIGMWSMERDADRQDYTTRADDIDRREERRQQAAFDRDKERAKLQEEAAKSEYGRRVGLVGERVRAEEAAKKAEKKRVASLPETIAKNLAEKREQDEKERKRRQEMIERFAGRVPLPELLTGDPDELVARFAEDDSPGHDEQEMGTREEVREAVRQRAEVEGPKQVKAAADAAKAARDAEIARRGDVDRRAEQVPEAAVRAASDPDAIYALAEETVSGDDVGTDEQAAQEIAGPLQARRNKIDSAAAKTTDDDRKQKIEDAKLFAKGITEEELKGYEHQYPVATPPEAAPYIEERRVAAADKSAKETRKYARQDALNDAKSKDRMERAQIGLEVEAQKAAEKEAADFMSPLHDQIASDPAQRDSLVRARALEMTDGILRARLLAENRVAIRQYTPAEARKALGDLMARQAQGLVDDQEFFPLFKELSDRVAKGDAKK